MGILGRNHKECPILACKAEAADRSGTSIGTLDNPIIVNSVGDEQYAGCTGYPADSHNVVWLTVS